MMGRAVACITRRPRLFLLVALVLVVDAAILGSSLADRLGSGGTDDPRAESARVQRVLDEHYPDRQPNLVLLVSAPEGGQVDDRDVARRGVGIAERLAFEESVVGVVSYWSTGAFELRSRDGTQAVVAAHIEGDEDEARAVLRRLEHRYAGSSDGLTVQVSGAVAVQKEIQTTIAEDLTRSELLVLPLTLAVLVWVFGSVVAALLPVAVGIIAILGTNAALRLLTGVTEVSIFAQNLTTALGLGLAVDYALLIVRRYREELPAAADPRQAVLRTVRTAGRTVLFSALTVAASLAALLVFPLYFLRSFAYAGVSVVLIAALTALTVLPALLVLLGPRVDAWTVRRRPHGGTAGGTAGNSPGTDRSGARWGRLATAVMGRARLVGVVVTGLLLLLGMPFLDARYGTADHRQLPQSSGNRVVQETLRNDFAGSPESAVPVLLRTGGAEGTDRPRGGHRAGSGDGTGDTRDTDDTSDTRRYARKLSALPGVEEVESSAGVFRDGEYAESPTPADDSRRKAGYDLLTVISEDDTSATSAANQRLVRAVRAALGPERAHTGGPAAVLVDSKEAIGRGLGPALAVVLCATLLLVFLMTGSVVLPFLAVALNVLSLTAMFGAVVWVFQEGRLSGLLGFTPTGDIETTLPVLMFCVAFGLSMDYGMFLLARIKEVHDRTGDHRAAVVQGIRSTGGLITAAALILAVVFAAMGASRITNSKMLGVGVALAVLTDTLVVRGLLTPAVLALTRHRTWWAPPALRRLHQRFGLREVPAPPQPSSAPERTPEAVGAYPTGPSGSGHSPHRETP